MREASTILVAVFCSMSQTARAETRLVSDPESKALCEGLHAELEQIGIDVSAPTVDANPRRSRRRAFASETVNALAICRTKPAGIEVFYPDGSRLGEPVFAVSTEDDAASAAVYVSERIRSERFIADVPVPVPFAPAVWWLGAGADVLFSPGGIAPLVFVTLDLGYRFHRNWSLRGFASIQPYMRRLDSGPAQTQLRLDQFGIAVAYHPVVTERIDLALGIRAAATRLRVNGTRAIPGGQFQGQRDDAWLVFPAGRASLRISLTKRFWLRLDGELGALLPRAVVSGGAIALGSLGELAAQVGFGMEVHFR